MLTYSEFNTVEGIFWVILALVCVTVVWRKVRYRRAGIFAAIMFLLFGISDFVEIQTGGFIGHSTWVLVWKVLCVIGIVVSIVWFVRVRMTIDNK